MNIFWFRRDLRLHDNTALLKALSSGEPVLPVFIFDTTILKQLASDDSRVSFIYDQIQSIDNKLKTYGSGLQVFKGTPLSVMTALITKYPITKLFFNRDYEPSAIKRDQEITALCEHHNITVHSCKDQAIFEPGEVLKADGNPYTVYTPFKNKWLEQLKSISIEVNAFENIKKQSFYQF